MIIVIENLEELSRFALRLSQVVKAGDAITLQGNLGAGKSELARAFIKLLLGADTVVPSPTFTIVEQYQAPNFLISHFDLYRLEGSEELTEIGFEEALSSGVCLIEWPERLEGYPLVNHLSVEITADIQTQIRKISLVGDENWQGRLDKI